MVRVMRRTGDPRGSHRSRIGRCRNVPGSCAGHTGRTPANGTTVYEVTAYAFLWDVPGTLMNQVDATAPFTYTIGS